MTISRQPRRSLLHVIAAPAMIALATLIGLVAGLIGDGIWNVAAWAGLAAPIAIAVPRLCTRLQGRT